MVKVSLICGNEKIEADSETVFASSFLRSLAEKGSFSGEIYVNNIRPSILRSVLVYCEHFKGKTPATIARPLLTPDLRENGADEWSASFIDTYAGRELWDLIATAYWLKIRGLLDLGCARVAALIKSRNEEDLQDVLEFEPLAGPTASQRPLGIAAYIE